MKPSIAALCAILLLGNAGYAQPAGLHALDDQAFDTDFAGRTIPIVTGKLINISQEEISKTPITYSLVSLVGQVRKTTQVEADGTFRLQLDYPLPYQQIWLSVGEMFYTGIYVNKDVHVEVDVQKVKAPGKELLFNGPGIRFLGTDGPLNEYTNNFILFRREEQLALDSRIQQIPRLSKPSAATVQAAYGGIYDSVKMIVDDYTAKNPSPYAWLLENEYWSEYYGRISVTYWGHEMDAPTLSRLQKHKTYSVTNSSVGFYRYLSNYFSLVAGRRTKIAWKEVALLPDLTTDEKLAVDSLLMAERQTAGTAYSTGQVAKWTKVAKPRKQRLVDEQLIDNGIRAIDSNFTGGKADILKLLLNDSKDINEQRYALEQLMPAMQTAWCNAIARANYSNTLSKMAAINKAMSNAGNSMTAADFGKPLVQTAFGASLYKVSNVKGADFLAGLKKSFPGKAIVFDLWATWCAPCLGEMPHSKKLQETSKDLSVVFVYVCTNRGSDEEKWKRKIGELNLPGVHFFIDEALDADLSQFFSFSGYPGYAFIDRKGVYKPGAIKRVSQIPDRAALAALVD
ncbi:TlpA disulfide reductase family protein [Paraflavitalea sp. CAU 1676]|uniref:TlpA family protein disulfide reductase n=1 Tax=Paraflavitalea sp. CAU 1676 TaxID=3032598 RepID=UPI0023DBB6FC|nr:TlpA disulfide reductase family protein [Paraflavitalea sp. CAU 1676]MDF2192674.1 TlpA disulfide reductase family protein [Paraflavitalea sp. CAU 1676]